MQLERSAREVHQGKRDLEDALTETQVGCNAGRKGSGMHSVHSHVLASMASFGTRSEPGLHEPFQPHACSCGLLLPQAAQGELGKAAQDFRRLHAERAELLAQWEAVAEAVRRRDADILAAGERCVAGVWSVGELEGPPRGGQLIGEAVRRRVVKSRHRC